MQSAVESVFRSRGYLGKRGCSEKIISAVISVSTVQSRGQDSLKGVEFVTPKI